MTKALLTGLVALFLTGCSTHYLQNEWKPQEGLLLICLSQPKGSIGQTNGSLLEGFLVAQEGHLVCRGVVQSLHNEFYKD